MDRAVFFERSDMAYGTGFDRIEQLPIPDFVSIDINDAIEFLEIKRYFDDGIRARHWTDEQYDALKEKSKKLFGLTMRFFNTLSDATIVGAYEKIEGHFYQKRFWVLFNYCKLYQRISPDAFDSLLHTEHSSLYDILIYKEIAKQYGVVIRAFLLNRLDYIHLILQVYEQDYTKNEEKLFLPDEFSNQDLVDFIDAYIDSDFPNPNHLKTIAQMRSKKGSLFQIPDTVKLKALRKNEERNEEVFKDGISYEYGLEIVFSPDQEELKLAKEDGKKQSFFYSKKWLLETLGSPNVLENFIYVFEFVDISQVRCQLVSKDSQSGVFERAMQSRSERVYPVNMVFHFRDGLSNIQMSLYYGFLKNNGVRLEEVLEWFFTKYLQKDFKCSEMRITLPSEGAPYSEKCHTICIAFESAIKQFSLYVEHGEIDFELLALSSGSKRIDDTPSLVENKYIYGIGEEFERIKFILFSDQCMFSHVKRIYDEGRLYNRFFDLIRHEDIFLSDYRDYEQETFRWLAEQDVLTIDEDGLLKLGNSWKVKIVKDLFKNDVISYWHYPSESYPVFQEWINKGYLETKSSLLSRSEAEYYNFILNDSVFDNGLKLRNKYLHGNQSGIMDERIHEQNYIILLKLFIILAIKINDDFSLKEQQDQMNLEA